MNKGKKMSGVLITLLIVAVFVLGLFPVVKFLYSNVYPYMKDGYSQDRVLETGEPANAEIIHARQTDSWGGNKPIYQLTLRFQTKENKTIEATILKALSFQEIERFSPGNGTTIKYDQSNPRKIAIYDKPLVLGDR